LLLVVSMFACENTHSVALGLARALVIDSNLLKSFWAKAVSTAVYNRNRAPTNAPAMRIQLRTKNGMIENLI